MASMSDAVACFLESGRDYSEAFHKIRQHVQADDGTYYVDFIARLKPRYRTVWNDILLGYLALLATCLLVALSKEHGWLTWACAVLGSVGIGYWIAYLQLFMHEAAHFNLTRDRRANDIAANIFVCAIAGQEVARYRRVHFQHHRALGRADDSEQSYANPLTPRFVLRILTGIQSLEVITRRRNHLSSENATSKHRSFFSPWILLTLAIHLLVLTVAWYSGALAFAASWIAGAGIVFPCFGALRNLLEHRPHAAYAGPDAAGEAVTRIFGDGLFSSTFGGAGFNRHLLHHWEPQVSYTNLRELEQFLLTTPLRDILAARRTTYWRTLRELFQWSVA